MTTLHFRAMTVADLDEITFIVNQSFPTPWSTKTFEREIRQNKNGYYWVLTAANAFDIEVRDASHEKLAQSRMNVVSYGGYWLLEKDAHVVTLATHPCWRRQGAGKLLLIEMIREAVKSSAEIISLEVRESNKIAIQLYTELGFVEEGRRKEYYTTSKTSSEREDALILTLRDAHKSNYSSRLLQAHADALTRVEENLALTKAATAPNTRPR